MRNSPDPSVHRQAERQFMEHVERLLGDDRLRVDTTRGRRAVTTLFRSVKPARPDEARNQVRMQMDQAGWRDREALEKMPIGDEIEVVLSQKKMFFLKEVVGKINVICLPPIKALVNRESPQPLRNAEVQKVLTRLSMAGKGSDVPSTVVLVSTSGFEMDAHEL